MSRDPGSRRCRPQLEGLEAREVPSTLHVVGPAPCPHSEGPYLNLVVLRDAPPSQAARAHAAATPPWVNPAVLERIAAELHAPVTTTTTTTIGGQTFPPGTYNVPQPTPAEIGRQTFWMEFVGHYYVGAPRFSNQSATIHIYSNGRNVTSNQSSHNRGQVLLLPPADPNATPTTNDPMAGQVAGLLSMFPANALQSGSQFFGNITNRPDVPSNDPRLLDHGLPAHLQFTLDPGGVTGAIYAVPAYTVTNNPQVSQAGGGSLGAVGFTQGAGVIDIRYLPTNRLRDHAAQSGTAIVRVQGLLNTTGLTNPLYKGIN
jgi:hypothetical protein